MTKLLKKYTASNDHDAKNRNTTYRNWTITVTELADNRYRASAWPNYRSHHRELYAEAEYHDDAITRAKKMIDYKLIDYKLLDK